MKEETLNLIGKIKKIVLFAYIYDGDVDSTGEGGGHSHEICMDVYRPGS